MIKISKKFQPLITPVISWLGSVEASENFEECYISPLENGFGTTFGNTLRRILLSGIEGSAVVSVIINGINNEFSVMPGIVEDAMRILLNIKQLVIKNSTGLPGKLTFNFKGKKNVIAADFQCEEHLEIINKDLHIATIAEDGFLNMILFVDVGRGYRKADWLKDVSLQEDNRIFIDSTFAPVRNVAFDITKTRVGKDIDYDKLKLAITTDGTITPRDAYEYAVSVALNQFQSFLNKEEIKFPEKVNDKNFTLNKSKSNENRYENKINMLTMLSEIISLDILLKSIDILGLPARAHNCLLSYGIQRVLDLVNMTENDVMNIKNFGKKSYEDLLQIMKDFGLKFDMDIEEKMVLEVLGKINHDASK